MKIKLDLDLCQGHSVCMGECPEVFDVVEQEDGYPIVTLKVEEPGEELREKVLLPILEDHYGKVLEAGELRLSFDEGSFRMGYRDHVLPIDPKTAVSILEPCLGSLAQTSGPRDKYQREIQSIIATCRDLP